MKLFLGLKSTDLLLHQSVRNASMIRDRVLARTVDMLEHLRIQVSMLPETEIDVLKAIEKPAQFDFAIAIANFIMGKLGHEVGAPKDPRFDKTRRQMNKRRGRPPRGIPRSELNETLEEAHAEA